MCQIRAAPRSDAHQRARFDSSNAPSLRRCNQLQSGRRLGGCLASGQFANFGVSVHSRFHRRCQKTIQFCDVYTRNTNSWTACRWIDRDHGFRDSKLKENPPRKH
eukprot:scaffold113414_cov68-Phaeocystis_antarctica.AAC.1